MKTSFLEKHIEQIETLFKMITFYLSSLGLLFMLHLLLGTSIGMTALPYELMRTLAIQIGAFTLCITAFLTDLIFTKLDYKFRLILCVLCSFAYIEGYTIYTGLILYGQPLKFISHNQMSFLIFLFLLTCWAIYSKCSMNEYKKLLKDYQDNNQIEL